MENVEQEHAFGREMCKWHQYVARRVVSFPRRVNACIAVVLLLAFIIDGELGQNVQISVVKVNCLMN